MGPGGNQGSRSSPRDAPSLERGSIALTAGAPISGCGHHRALHRTRRADRRGDRGRGWTPAEFIAADLNDIESVRRLAEQAGEIDVLVNNAAAHTFAPTLEHDLESFGMTFDVNVRGPFFLTAALLPKMIARGSGAIVNISTMGASVDVADGPVAAAEAALESFTRSWAAAFGAHGIRVNTVAPGPTRTEGTVGTLGDGLEQLGSATPLGRTADPTEIAEAIVSWCRRGRATLPARPWR